MTPHIPSINHPQPAAYQCGVVATALLLISVLRWLVSSHAIVACWRKPHTQPQLLTAASF
jgi:hypothetical protein